MGSGTDLVVHNINRDSSPRTLVAHAGYLTRRNQNKPLHDIIVEILSRPGCTVGAQDPVDLAGSRPGVGGATLCRRAQVIVGNVNRPRNGALVNDAQERANRSSMAY